LLLASTFSKSVENDVRNIDNNSALLSENRITAPVSAEASVKLNISHKIRLGKLYGFVVDVKNESEEALVFDGEHAMATSPTCQFQLASVSDVASIPSPRKPFLSRFLDGTIETAIGAGGVGSVAAVTDVVNNAGPVEHRYGPDEARRIDEQSRFGRRVLFPGESSVGVVYFKKSKQSHEQGKPGDIRSESNNRAAEAAETMTMPVRPLYDGNSQDSINK